MSIACDDMTMKHPEFQDKEIPPTGHFERFEERLVRRTRQRKLRSLQWIISTAVAAMVVVVLMFHYTRPKSSIVFEQSATNETLSFYDSRLMCEMEDVVKEIDQLDAVSRKDVLADLETMKNDNRLFAQQGGMINEGAFLAAIVTHYNAQMESLERIRMVLQRTQTLKKSYL